MDVTLNHTIVHAIDPQASADFLCALLDLAPAVRLGHFTVVQLGPTSLDFVRADQAVTPRHFAFRVDEALFDRVMEKLTAAGLSYWADPFHRQPGEINHWDDGRGVYFDDPAGHNFEVLTRPYGSGGCGAKHPNPLLDCT